jgi:hypothetical protein
MCMHSIIEYYQDICNSPLRPHRTSDHEKIPLHHGECISAYQTFHTATAVLTYHIRGDPPKAPLDCLFLYTSVRTHARTQHLWNQILKSCSSRNFQNTHIPANSACIKWMNFGAYYQEPGQDGTSGSMPLDHRRTFNPIWPSHIWIISISTWRRLSNASRT